MESTRGIKNNNPGNIRITGVTWIGQLNPGTDPAFITFTDPKWGIRAIARILFNYQRSGVLTIREAIERWAPSSENDTEAYVLDVCQRCGVQPDDKVDFGAIMPQLVKAIIHHENGEQPYDDQTVNYGISLA